MQSQIVVTRKRLYDENEEATQPEGCGAMLATLPGDPGHMKDSDARWWIEFPSGSLHCDDKITHFTPLSIGGGLGKRINIAFLEGWHCWALWNESSQRDFSLNHDSKLTAKDIYISLGRYFNWVDGKWWEELVSVSYWVHEVEVAIKNEIIPSDTPSDKYILLVCNMTIDVTNNALVLARSIIESEKYDDD